MLVWDNKPLIYGGKFFDFEYLKPRYIYLAQTVGGTISADKLSGMSGDIVSLSNTPSAHYVFLNYNTTGATLTGNQFTINESNVTAKANFSAWPVRNVSVQQRTGGTIASNKSTGYDGDVVTLSNTADTGYTFTNYNVIGATLTGNQFAFNGGNVTAQGAFNHDVYNLTLQQTSGGTITADKTTGYYGDTVTLSNTANSGYEFTEYTITGASLTSNKFKFSESNVTAQCNWLNYNPLDLPPYTIRLKYKSGVTPIFKRNTSSVQVSQNPNVWDVTYENNSWRFLFYNQTTQITGLIEVLGANSTNISSMQGMFQRCRALSSVALFDTRNVTDMDTMFDDCPSLITVPKFNTSNVKSMDYMFWQDNNAEGALTSVPLFDTHNVSSMEYMFTRCHSLLYVPEFDTSNVVVMNHMCTDCHSISAVPDLNLDKVRAMDYAFAGCYVVQIGALNLYNKASTKPNITQHNNTFYYCGSDTQTGSAELAQIPDDWK